MADVHGTEQNVNSVNRLNARIPRSFDAQVRPTRCTNARWLPSLRNSNKRLTNLTLRTGTVVLPDPQRWEDRCQFGLAVSRGGCIARCGFASVLTRIGEHDLCRKRQHACALRRRTPPQESLRFVMSIRVPGLRSRNDDSRYSATRILPKNQGAIQDTDFDITFSSAGPPATPRPAISSDAASN